MNLHFTEVSVKKETEGTKQGRRGSEHRGEEMAKIKH